MTKLALCVSLQALVDLGLDTSIPRSLQSVDLNMVVPEHFTYEDRAYVDAPDMVIPASAIPQIIGYGVFKVVNYANEDLYICYKRPSTGDETRLHGNYSLGFGGHIEPVDEAMSPIATIKAALQREIFEEVGLHIDPHEIVFDKLIVDTTNDVGKVHIGLPAIITINPTRADIIIHGANEEVGSTIMFTKASMLDNIEYFENWSQIVIKELL